MTESVLPLDKREVNLIKLLRELEHGHLTVFVQDALPVRIEKGIESKKL